MKNYFKFIVAAVAALILTTAAVNAAVTIVAEETITVTSQSVPAANCKLALSQAESIFHLLPSEVQDQCRSEYTRLSKKCKTTPSFKYQGVSFNVSENSGLVDLTLSYKGYVLKVENTTWAHLDQIFN